MRQTAHRKHGQFLTANERVQPVDCGNTRLDKLVGIIACGGVDRLAVDIHFLFGDNGRAVIARIAHTVEYASQHVLGHGKLLAMP